MEKCVKSYLQHSSTVSMARLLASCNFVQIGMDVLLTPPSWHRRCRIGPSRVAATSAGSSTTAWCRLEERHIYAAPLAGLNVPGFWQHVVFMPISVTRQFKWGWKPVYSRQPNSVGNYFWLRWCPLSFKAKRALPWDLVLRFSFCTQKLFLKHFSLLHTVCTNMSE